MNVSFQSCKRKSVEWYTPPWIFEELAIEFDLDPSSPHDRELPWIPAKKRYTVFDDGLSKEWHDRVWMNPPYGEETEFWMRRMAAHGNGIALVFSRTDTEWFHEAISTAGAVLFIKGRIDFIPGRENEHKKSRSGAANVMFAWGADCVEALKRLAHRGFITFPNQVET
jgi:phage N-6-adenine-methyltransferase